MKGPMEFYSTTQFLNIRFKYDNNKKFTGADAERVGNNVPVKSNNV